MPSPRPEPVRKLTALSWTERRLLVRSAITLPVAVASLRLVGYDRTVRGLGRLGRLHRRAPAGSELDDRITSSVAMVRAASNRLPVPSACLAQSVTLWSVLRRSGIEGEIVIAVRAGGHPVDAHAWVEHDGRPLNETPEVAATYRPLRRGRLD